MFLFKRRARHGKESHGNWTAVVSVHDLKLARFYCILISMSRYAMKVTIRQIVNIRLTNGESWYLTRSVVYE